MYSDPKHIKKHPYKVSLNDEQRQLIEMAAGVAGEQPSAYLRELAMEKLREMLSGKHNEARAS
ncbi:MAG TPA: hypothetical protein DCF82_23185 [Marinobacter hydrocarbonoclasticus]|jgi:uncharacterized protein (DUF1778 family)|uniref:Uncharacterized protein n=1 Tax=Marinobacter nauticus TaxID=2743 RepID=A0A3B8WKH4_MARNT|nr:hypothetical protein [Marinobacter nauticus]HIC14303.1 hypothetical protein [Gemmatimonadota bacterium]|tara:strand:- start:691 stop:879 length:189 start_codon:yes stop_codon:yes gene_type:complete